LRISVSGEAAGGGGGQPGGPDVSGGGGGGSGNGSGQRLSQSGAGHSALAEEAVDQLQENEKIIAGKTSRYLL